MLKPFLAPLPPHARARAGVLGPKSNAHGPNEFMHIGMFKNVTCSVAHVLAKHYDEKVAKAAKK